MAIEEAVLAENGFIYTAGKTTNSEANRPKIQEATDFYQDQASFFLGIFSSLIIISISLRNIIWNLYFLF